MAKKSPIRTHLIATLFLSCTLLWLFSSTSFANQHEDLLNEYNNYRPGSLYDGRFTAQPAAVPVTTATAENDALLHPHETPAQSESYPPFLSPDPRLIERLAPLHSQQELESILGGRLQLDDLLALVLLRNPMVDAAQSQVEAAINTISQAANLDAILKEYSAFSEALMNGVGPMKGESPQEKFPFPALASLKGRIAGQEVIIAREKLEIARRTMVTAAESQFWNLLYNRQAQELYGKMAGLLEHLQGVARSRYETGAAGFQEFIQVQINLATIREEQVNLAEFQATIEETIRQLADLPPQTKIGSPTAPMSASSTKNRQEPSIADLTKTALRHRQELHIEQVSLTKMELLIDLAESMILPPFTLNLADYRDNSVTQVGSSAPQETFAVSTTADTGKGLPKMPWFGTNDAFLQRTRHLLSARQATLKNMESETRTLVLERWMQSSRPWPPLLSPPLFSASGRHGQPPHRQP